MAVMPPLFHGAVVDMFYFPLYDDRLPEWVPIWGGRHVTFFRPVFNIADAASPWASPCYIPDAAGRQAEGKASTEEASRSDTGGGSGPGHGPKGLTRYPTIPAHQYFGDPHGVGGGPCAGCRPHPEV